MSFIILSTVPRRNPNHPFPEINKLPNIGLSYCAESLRMHDHDTMLREPGVEGLSIHEFADQVSRMRPLLFGMSCYSGDIDNASILAEYVKRKSPGTSIVVGGPHPSAIPSETLKDYSAFDFVISGEGEAALVQLANALSEATTDFFHISGLTFRDGGEVIENGKPTTLIPLDDLPFPTFDGLPLKKYRRMYSWMKGLTLPIQAARGCPFSCSFCFPVNGREMRYRSIDSIITEMERDVSDYHARNLVFVDSTFSIKQGRIYALCQKMIARGLHKKLKWVCTSRIDTITSELLRLMNRAGCETIVFGLESGSQEILDRLYKGISLEAARQAVESCTEAGIRANVNFIIGNPYDTLQTINKTIDFAASLPAEHFVFSFLTPFPGTVIRRMAEQGEGGLVLLSRDWRKYSQLGGAALELEDIPIRKLHQLLLKEYIRSYIRPTRITNLLDMVDPLTLGTYVSRAAARWILS